MKMLPDKMSRLEFSNRLACNAPDNSEEFWAFHNAAHYYDKDRDFREAGTPQSKYRMRAVRYFKKGWKLREKRVQEKLNNNLNK